MFKEEDNMKNTTNVKDNIIEVTTELIEHFKGNTKSITARMIAERAGVGLGLINYHFGSKENLITTCVQRIIGKVIAGFDVNIKYKTDQERLTAWATYVFNFLFDHSAISRISILGDLQNYLENSNSVYTQKGFMKALVKDIPNEDKPLFSFMLTASMQVAFLSNDAAKGLIGYDFTKQEDRAAYIEKVVDILFDGGKKEELL